MSCWIVNDKVLSRIVDFIKYDQHKYGWGNNVPLCELSEQEIGEKLRAMNEKAYGGRYGCYGEGIKPFVYQDNRGAVSVYQHLKDLNCYRYQCGEGRVPEMKLYKQIEALIQAVESHIIAHLPEYDKATWGE